MNLLAPVSSIMTKNLVTLKSNDSIATAAEVFKTKKVHHIPVVDNGKLVGMLSKSDYLFFRRGFLNNQDDEKIEEIRMQNYEVSFIMSKVIATLESSDRINVTLDIFKENMFHAIPIVDNGQLCGMVTTYDIIKNLAEDKTAVNEYA